MDAKEDTKSQLSELDQYKPKIFFSTTKQTGAMSTAELTGTVEATEGTYSPAS